MKNTGTLVIAPIRPYDDQDTHATHEAKYGKGGFRTVASTAERDAIPAARREEGMRVWVVADGTVYKLEANLSTWTDAGDGNTALLRADLASTTAGKGASLVKFQGGKTVQDLADAAADEGSALVGFVQSGAGAVARNVQDKLRDFITPQDFGALANGIADDTVSMQSWAAAVGAGGGYLPDGDYLISNQITFSSAKAKIIAQSRNARIVLAASFPAKYPFLVGGGAGEIEGLIFDGFTIDGNNIAGVLGGIDVRNVSHSAFDNLHITNMVDGTALRFVADAGSERTYNNMVRNPRFNNVKHGVKAQGTSGAAFCTRNFILGGQIRGRGIGIAGGIGLELGDATHTVGTHTILGTDMSAFDTAIDNYGSNNRIGAWLEGNNLDIRVRSTSERTMLDWNSMASTTAIQVDAGAGRLLGHSQTGAIFSYDLSPAALAATENDYNLTEFGEIYRMTPASGGSTLTGFTKGYRGRRITIMNISGTDNIILGHLTGSAAANQIRTPTNTSMVIPPEGSAELFYDFTSTKWRVLRVVGTNDLGIITPAQITADQNDYNPSAIRNLWRLSSDAARNITGIAGARTDRRLTIVNVGAQNIVLQNQNAGSVAANRIITGTGADVVLGADDTAILFYDATSLRWRVLNTH